MKLKVKELNESHSAEYRQFLTRPNNQAHQTFYHSYEWGEFMRIKAIKFVRFGVFDQDDQLIAVGQASLQKLKLGKFWYCPRGLAMDYSKPKTVKKAYQSVVDYFSDKDGAAFLRLDPNIDRDDQLVKSIDSCIPKPKQAAIFTQAERCWVVDLQPEDTDGVKQLAWLKENGARSNVSRYLRKAARAGLTVRASESLDDLEIFISMINKLNSRKGGIGKHLDDHYRKQFNLMQPAGHQKIFLAEKDGEVLACTYMAIYGNEASYLHGASSDTQRDLSAPHSLHFETMKYLQKNYPNVKRYNFWGIVGDKNRTPKHPRHGYSEFKRSFGGYKVHYMRSRDFVYNYPVWAASYAIDKYRTWKHKND